MSKYRLVREPSMKGGFYYAIQRKGVLFWRTISEVHSHIAEDDKAVGRFNNYLHHLEGRKTMILQEASK